MGRLHPALVTCLLMVTAVGHAAPPGPTLIKLDLEAATKSLSTGALQVVEVKRDALYGTAKHFRGIGMASLLQARGIDPRALPPGTIVEFICVDGYQPVASLDVMVRDRAFLALADPEASHGRTWLPLPGDTKEPGPGYLVWPEGNQDPEHPWPYGLVSIRIGTVAALEGAAFPRAPEMRTGFELFRAHCMKCHSVNGAGGTVGVELNVPRNVFEYWQPPMLPEFIKNPALVRKNSKMPSFDQLGDEAIGEILHYLKSMRENKGGPDR